MLLNIIKHPFRGNFYFHSNVPLKMPVTPGFSVNKSVTCKFIDFYSLTFFKNIFRGLPLYNRKLPDAWPALYSGHRFLNFPWLDAHGLKKI